jgi:hypothetical protein
VGGDVVAGLERLLQAHDDIEHQVTERADDHGARR